MLEHEYYSAILYYTIHIIWSFSTNDDLIAINKLIMYFVHQTKNLVNIQKYYSYFLRVGIT